MLIAAAVAGCLNGMAQVAAGRAKMRGGGDNPRAEHSTSLYFVIITMTTIGLFCG